MITSITCSNFPKYVFNFNSSKLSAEAQKKARFWFIFMTATVIGLPLCGIACLITRCCNKGSKTNRVALHELNSTDSQATNTPIRVPPSGIEAFFHPFIEKISEGWNYFERQIGLEELESISIHINLGQRGNLPSTIIPISASQPPNKNDLLRIIINCITNLYTRHVGNHTPEESYVMLTEEPVAQGLNNGITIKVVMQGREANGFRSSVSTSFHKNGMTSGLLGPSFQRINCNHSLSENVRF